MKRRLGKVMKTRKRQQIPVNYPLLKQQLEQLIEETEVEKHRCLMTKPLSTRGG